MWLCCFLAVERQSGSPAFSSADDDVAMLFSRC